MESFFQRMSSIVIWNNNRFSEHDIDNEEANEREKRFQYLVKRRCSAPDIHRNVMGINRVIRIPNNKGISDEQIATHFYTSKLPRKHFNSTGKF